MQVSVAVLFASLLAASFSTSTFDPIGVWKTPVDEGLIRIERCGADICGRPAGSARLRTTPDQRDVMNKDPALRGRLIKDILIFKLRPTGPGHWGKGTIYNPNDGGTYSAEITLAGPAQLRLKGCVAPLLCQTQTWKRAE